MSNDSIPDPDQPISQIGRWMFIALWLLVLGFGTWFAHLYLEKRARGQIPTNITGTDGRRSVLLEGDRRGHYVVAGEVNGHEVTFLVDTGASGVSIPQNVADKLGLNRGLRYPVNTANGTIDVFQTRLNWLSIGDVSRENVDASINPSMDGEVALLGMTFLRHFELVQRGNALTIREP